MSTPTAAAQTARRCALPAPDPRRRGSRPRSTACRSPSAYLSQFRRPPCPHSLPWLLGMLLLVGPGRADRSIPLIECLLYYSRVTTELKQNVAVPIVLGVGTALLGVGVGFALPALARLLVTLIDRTSFPVHGVIDLASDLPLGWSVGIVGVLGVVAGLYVAHAAAREALHLEVTRDHLKYRQEDRSGWVEREDLSAV